MLGYIRKVSFDISEATITFETQDIEGALRELLPHRKEQIELSIKSAQAELPLMPQRDVIRHGVALTEAARVVEERMP